MIEQRGQWLEVSDANAQRSVSTILDLRTRERLKSIIEDGTPPNTKRAYASDIRYFWAWASAIGWTDEPLLPVPAEVVARFVADHIEGLDEEVDTDLIERGNKARPGPHAIATVDRRVSALSTLHKMSGFASPCADPIIVKLMSKARKAAARRGQKPRKKRAAVRTILDAMLADCSSDSVIDIRDSALLLFGWSSGGRRRSEIAQATYDQLERVGSEFIFHLGITKTTQDGEGGTVPVKGRAAEAMRNWLDVASISDGHLFRGVDRHGNIKGTGLSDRTVARIIQKRASAAAYDGRFFGGHSLRSGFLTEAGLRNISLLEAMKMSQHKTMQVAAGYHQAGNALHNEAGSMLDQSGDDT